MIRGKSRQGNHFSCCRRTRCAQDIDDSLNSVAEIKLRHTTDEFVFLYLPPRDICSRKGCLAKILKLDFMRIPSRIEAKQPILVCVSFLYTDINKRLYLKSASLEFTCTYVMGEDEAKFL